MEKMQNLNILTKNIRIPVILKKTVLETVVKHGTEADWFDLYKFSLKNVSYSEKVENIYALTTTKNLKLLQLYNF